MTRLGLIVFGLAAVTATQAFAQSKIARMPHVARVAAGETVVPRSEDSLALNNAFSDPYAKGLKGGAGQFPPIRSHPPVEPQGGFSIRAGRDNPDEPMTGGLKFRF